MIKIQTPPLPLPLLPMEICKYILLIISNCQNVFLLRSVSAF